MVDPRIQRCIFYCNRSTSLQKYDRWCSTPLYKPSFERRRCIFDNFNNSSESIPSLEHFTFSKRTSLDYKNSVREKLIKWNIHSWDSSCDKRFEISLRVYITLFISFNGWYYTQSVTEYEAFPRLPASPREFFLRTNGNYSSQGVSPLSTACTSAL